MRRNAALVVAFLCALTFVMPWAEFVSDPFYVHTWSIFASSLLVACCFMLSRSLWSVGVQTVEVACIIYQAQIVFNWDNPADLYYIHHDQFMLCAFILELLLISTSLTKIAAVLDGISDALRRTFLFTVRLYPSERGGIHLPHDKEFN